VASKWPASNHIVYFKPVRKTGDPVTNPTKKAPEGAFFFVCMCALFKPAFAFTEVIAAELGAGDHLKLGGCTFYFAGFGYQWQNVFGIHGVLAIQFVTHAEVPARQLNMHVLLVPVIAMIAGCFHDLCF
jgi:hypothetical protein